MNPKLEKIKQENPTLWNEIREYFSPEGLRRQLREYRAAADVAEAKIAVLQEQSKLIKLKSEATLLESRNHRLRRQQRPLQQARLLNDDEVRAAYDRVRK